MIINAPIPTIPDSFILSSINLSSDVCGWIEFAVA